MLTPIGPPEVLCKGYTILPAPTASGPAFIYAPSTTGITASHGLGQVLALANGRFAALSFADRFDYQTFDSVTQTSFWSYDALSPLSSTRIPLEIPERDLRGLPQIAALDEGRLVVWWGVQTGSGQNFAVEFRAQFLDTAGNTLGDPMLIGDFSTNTHGFTPLAQGGMVMSFEKYTQAGGWDSYIRFYDAAGVAGPDIRINSTTEGRQESPRLVQMEDGNLFVTWRAPDQAMPWGQTGGIIGRILNPDGSPAGAEFIVSTSGELPNLYQTTLLADGNILVLWTTSRPSGDSYQTDAMARIFTPGGLAIGPEFSLAVNAAGEEAAPVVLALTQGGFVAMWMDDPDGADGNALMTIRGQLYSDTGAASGDEFAISPDGMNISSSFTAAALVDGRFVVSYVLQNGSGTSDTWAQILDPRSAAIDLTGGALAEDFVGTAFDDRLVGDAGADTLYGGDGQDTLNGGIGDDFLFGGATAADLRDVVYGGDGHDSIDGGYGNDELNGGNDNDTVSGGIGADTLIGNDGNDLLAGMGGGDLLYGNGGNDTLNGGFGYDRLNGGAGADSFYHQGVADHGSDWVQDYSAAEGDVLSVGIAGATASQFQVNFATTAGAGSAAVAEAFIIYKPTGQILWALVDGGDDSSINLRIAGQTFDLLA